MGIQILQGDAIYVMMALPSESVQCVVTSPPYWGLRDYGLPPTVWGGGDDCWHVWGDEQKPAGYRSNENRNTEGLASEAIQRRDQWQGSNFCHLCGAWRGQLGLEPTPELYVEHLVDVFREVKRVLREDGVLWLNLGDSYASNGGPEPAQTKWQVDGASNGQNGGRSRKAGCLKPKDLVGIPWRVAFALQADGWWLRSDIIWHKPNPMPESVTDRCTKAHEYVFMLSKSARYFYDAEAVREGSETVYRAREKNNGESAVDTKTRGHSGCCGAETGTRNRRDVWTIATQPYSGAHFAVMPPELAEVCIKAGSSEVGACPTCGSPWERVVERQEGEPKSYRRSRFDRGKSAGHHENRMQEGERGHTVCTGWRPTCDCDAEPIPCVVLDPFGGAGTTGLVADRLGRDAILIELNAEYCELAERRIKDDAGMWAEVVSEQG